jgi:dynein heavy chain
MQKIFGTLCKEFLASTNFSESTKKMWEPCVQSAVEVYGTISKELLPIPSKFHYIFNLRDISKVF